MRIYVIVHGIIISLMLVKISIAMEPEESLHEFPVDTIDYPYESDGYAASSERSGTPSSPETSPRDSLANRVPPARTNSYESHSQLSRDDAFGENSFNINSLIQQLAYIEQKSSLDAEERDSLHEYWQNIRNLFTRYQGREQKPVTFTTVITSEISADRILGPIHKTCSNLEALNAHFEYVEKQLDATGEHKVYIRTKVMPCL